MPMNAAQARAAGVYKPDSRKVQQVAQAIREGKMASAPVCMPKAFHDAVDRELKRASTPSSR